MKLAWHLISLPAHSGRRSPWRSMLRRTRQWCAAAVMAAAAITPVHAQPEAVFGRQRFVEYLPGNAPVILTAPHGGLLEPSEMPDRTTAACGRRVTTVHDRHTADLARVMQARFAAAHGIWPHVVIMHLHRRKVDANRPEDEATCGHPQAREALEDWHAFIDTAKTEVIRRHGRGWLIDLHGHGHPTDWLELGYLLTAEELEDDDAALNQAAALQGKSSIGALARAHSGRYADILRGPQSLGALYARHGIAAVPSPQYPAPGGRPYFTGGHNTLRHTCGAEAWALSLPPKAPADAAICGVQIESHFRGVRDTPASWERFGDITARVLEEFLRVHWGLQLRPESAARP